MSILIYQEIANIGILKFFLFTRLEDDLFCCFVSKQAHSLLSALMI